ncbi:MAG: flagellar filament capping protein FliD [Lachnospiraceae bacterium]
MINNVYSYYMSQYAAKPVTRHNSHKRSELKNVYSRMVDVNRTAPLYKLNLSEDMQKMAIDIKESAIELKDYSEELSAAQAEREDTRKKAVSSREDLVEARLLGETVHSDETHEVVVKQLAAKQKNIGHFLQPKHRQLQPGTYSFDAELSGVTYELQFNVNRQDTTEDVQKRIVQLINQSDIGLTAGIERDALGNTAISVESDALGVRGMKPNIFTISDENATYVKGAVDFLGMDRTIQYPSNAIFTVDGEEQSSHNNQFTINRNLEITLKAVTEEPVTVSVEEDPKAVAGDIDNFVNSYNRMLEFARNASDKFSGGGKLLSELERMTRAYSSTLKESGFTIQDDGSIGIGGENSGKFTNKEEVDKVLSNLQEFRNSVMRKTDHMIANPIEYIDKKIVAYKNPARSFPSPYSSSAYAGIMFDGYY